ncbi:alcohol dehydrogenase catalytic domain-containing protein [Streptomyces malaysiensis]|uniref:Alcohol dehydrogenase catalytic domain-containing protein n=1 Tax=Streptomyces malaysiensis subsp. samsunensis TaxID=459658 RepID=A0A9X2LYJ0_STRMQ|nr:alcohol dehydrogenase catalytic domain-containing protein [Streptomyces samsunensis]MCQ8832012.1 alcohol dehydrogenase catalytic domain-containing protein [Streptomyces samsunensis]
MNETTNPRQIRGAVLESCDNRRPFATSRPITVCDLQLSGPGPDEVLIRIEAAGVCHSDLSVVDGNRCRPTPMLLGHESAGRIVEVGDNVTDLKIGQRVVMAFLPRCGECPGCRTEGKMPCTAGSAANNAGTLLGGGIRLSRDGKPVSHHLGVSGFATHATVDRRSVTPVDDDVPPDVAALLGCAVLTGGGAVLNAVRPAPGQTVAVVGLGGVGMAAVLTAMSLGAEVVGVDAVESKLELVRSFGVAQALTPEQATDQGLRADLVVEAAGHPRAFETAVAITAPGGATVMVGLPGPEARSSVSPLTLTAEARTIVGSYLGSAVPQRDIPIYAQLWREGRLPVDRLISSRIRLDDINEAMDLLAGGSQLRQVIVFDGDETAPATPGTRKDRDAK